MKTNKLKEEQNKQNYKINKGRRKIGASGTIMEEEWLTVEAKTKEECEKMFDARWEKK